jgi:transcriptional regulator with XRE-family HTH domain
VKTFGETLRNLREGKGLLLRQIAAALEVDTAFVSKVERNERMLRKEQVQKVAILLDVPENELLTIWLAEKVSDLVDEEPFAADALNLSLRKLKKK